LAVVCRGSGRYFPRPTIDWTSFVSGPAYLCCCDGSGSWYMSRNATPVSTEFFNLTRGSGTFLHVRIQDFFFPALVCRFLVGSRLPFVREAQGAVYRDSLGNRQSRKVLFFLDTFTAMKHAGAHSAIQKALATSQRRAEDQHPLFYPHFISFSRLVLDFPD